MTVEHGIERRHAELQLVGRLSFDQLRQLMPMPRPLFQQRRQQDHFRAAFLHIRTRHS
jgi:hypothetical protein